MWGIIATWRMALDGIEMAASQLEADGCASDAVETAVRAVEDVPYFKSVGYGGLPNAEMDVELDAAFMDGTTLSFGAVGALHDFANPISVARALTATEANNLLVGSGADRGIGSASRKMRSTSGHHIPSKNPRRSKRPHAGPCPLKSGDTTP